MSNHPIYQASNVRRGDFRQTRGRQYSQQYSRGKRTTSNFPVDRPWKTDEKWGTWRDNRSESTPAHFSAQSVSRAECPAARRQRSESQNEVRRQESQQARTLLSNVKQAQQLAKNAWDTRRKLWTEVHCPEQLRPLARHLVVPPEYWDVPFERLNQFPADG